MRYVAFIVCATITISCLAAMAVGGYLTLQPALISSDTSDLLREWSVKVLAFAGSSAVFLIKKEWFSA